MSRLTDIFGPGVRDFFGKLLVRNAIASLRNASTHVATVEQAVSLAYDFGFCGIHITPSQIRSEITQLLQLLADQPPARVLEIGTLGGGTFFLLSHVASKEALLLSVDLPFGRFGGGYPKWRSELIRSFARGNQQIQLLAADSHSLDTVHQIKQLLKGSQLDFLFIDGDHRYEGVKADFQMYSALVRPGGLIAFHDIVSGPPALVGGVPAFWQELKKQCPAREFVANWNQGGYGIGLVTRDT
jgi:predicted O-methyltransferase YrrM